jgi:hypothetical protein
MRDSRHSSDVAVAIVLGYVPRRRSGPFAINQDVCRGGHVCLPELVLQESKGLLVSSVLAMFSPAPAQRSSETLTGRGMVREAKAWPYIYAPDATLNSTRWSIWRHAPYPVASMVSGSVLQVDLPDEEGE